jgi:hypothetical protein
MFPTGAYKVLLVSGIAEKTLNEGKENVGHFFDIQMKLVAEPKPGEVDTSSLEFGESVPSVGDQCNFLFDRQHKAGQSRFAEFCAPISEKFGCKSVREIMEKSKGLEGLVIIKREKGKTGKTYGNIVKFMVI